MNTLEFIASLVSTLVWPVAAIILAYLFREPLNKILLAISRIKVKGVEIDFDRKLKDAKAAFELSPKETATTTVAEPSTPYADSDEGPMQEEIEALTVSSPQAAIPLAWMSVRSEVKTAVERLGLVEGKATLNDTTGNLDKLHTAKAIDDNTYSAMRQMNELRNIAAHVAFPQPAITSAQASEFVDMSKNLTNQLHIINAKSIA